MASAFVAFVLRTNMSVAGEEMMRDLALSKTQLGVVLAAFVWGRAVFQFPGGVLGDRFGARRIIALSSICDASRLHSVGTAGEWLSHSDHPPLVVDLEQSPTQGQLGEIQ